jgi:hypothetical protein
MFDQVLQTFILPKGKKRMLIRKIWSITLEKGGWSHFPQGVIKIKDFFFKNYTKVVGNGVKTRF